MSLTSFFAPAAVLPGLNVARPTQIVVGQTGHADYVSGSAAMAALLGLTKSLAKKGGPFGITANFVAAGAIISDEKSETPGVLDAFAAAVPVGRCGRPEDVARAIAFLCDNDAGYITESTLAVNGGSFMH